MKRVLLILPLAAAGCSHITADLSSAGQGPGIYVCAGKGVVSAVGQIGMLGGANGSVTFDCGAGAYFGQGRPAPASLPNVPSGASPTVGMPTLEEPPVATPAS